MRDAIGGVLSLNIIFIFLIIISCYLAFSVNYTKAFRVKNEVRSIIEKQEGLTCEALDQINNLMINANYQFPEAFAGWCTDNDYIVVSPSTSDKITRGGFCYKAQAVDKYGNSNDDETYKGIYYTVATFTNVISLPGFGGSAAKGNDLVNFLGNIFVVKGETALIYSSGGRTTLPTCTGGEMGEYNSDEDNYMIETTPRYKVPE